VGKTTTSCHMRVAKAFDSSLCSVFVTRRDGQRSSKVSIRTAEAS
jgi:hypothetical protein